MGEEETVVLGGNEIDAEYRPNVSYVPPKPEVTSESEMSDEQKLETAEGQAETVLFKEEVTGEEKKETAPAEEPPEKKEEEKKAEEVKPDKQEKYSKEVQKRINQITREKYEERRVREKLEKENQELKKQLQTSDIDKTKFDIESRKPKSEDFEDETDFHIALGEWAAEKKIAEKDAEKATASASEETVEKEVDNSAAIDALIETGKDKYDDFETVVLSDSKLPLTEAVVSAALESDLAADILYHIGQNPDDAVRIAKLSPTGIAREIGKIEAGLSASQETAPVTENISEEQQASTDKPLKPKQTTNAPPPITPITPGATTTTPDQAKMTHKEYRASRGFTSGAMKKRE